MSRLCRELFPTILNTPGQLLELLEENFNEDRQLFYDIINSKNEFNFKDYIFEKLEEKTGEEEPPVIVDKTPKELLLEVGYDLYECKTVEELKEFKKYYTFGELLCTFSAGGNGQERLNKNMIFFIVHKDVDKIKRHIPKNINDDYSKSVLCIQIPYNRKNFITIISRYNHSVLNPGATFDNNLDKIVPGLTESFNKEYRVELKKRKESKFKLDNYTRDSNGKYYRFNYEDNNIYYCPNNIIIYNGEAIKYDRMRNIVFEGYILSKEKPPKIINYERRDDKDYQDSFINSIGEVEKISENKKKDEKTGEEYLEILITPKGENKKDVILCLDKDNNLISYENENVTEIGNNFLNNAKNLKRISILNVIKIGKYAFYESNKLEEINMQKVEEIGNNSFYYINKIERLDLINLRKISKSVFNCAKNLKILNIPNVEEIDSYVCEKAFNLEKIDASNVEKIGDYSFREVKKEAVIKLKNLREMGIYCFNNIPEVQKSRKKTNII